MSPTTKPFPHVYETAQPAKIPTWNSSKNPSQVHKTSSAFHLSPAKTKWKYQTSAQIATLRKLPTKNTRNIDHDWSIKSLSWMSSQTENFLHRITFSRRTRVGWVSRLLLGRCFSAIANAIRGDFCCVRSWATQQISLPVIALDLHFFFFLSRIADSCSSWPQITTEMVICSFYGCCMRVKMNRKSFDSITRFRFISIVIFYWF